MENDALTPTFTTLNDQADPTFNQLLGINKEGTIAGYFGSGAAGHPNQGYTLNPPYTQADYTNENFPGSTQTQVTGINDKGVTSGFFSNENNANLVNNNFGFIDKNGVFSTVLNPAGVNTGGVTVQQFLGVNDCAKAVGFFTDANGTNHGFTYDIKANKFNEVTPTGFTNVTAAAINNKGDVAGFGTDANGCTMGFLQKDGETEELKGPTGAVTVQALGVNDKDQVVGSFTDDAGNTHGFLFDEMKNMYTTLDDPNGNGTMTVANGINDKEQVVGFFLDPAGNTDGMLVNFKPSASS